MPDTTRHNRALWITQGLVAALFLFAGGVKLATPPAALAKMTPFAPLFIQFIGVCEIAGALGLILPGVFRVRTGLTPLAALGLAIIMLGAVVTTVVTMSAAAAIFPAVVGAALVIIARSRRPAASPSRDGIPFPASLRVSGGR
ncbi:MAG TPA: DoxX family protein [Gemmatimonadales bacterium]|jgi:hypothetical protein